MRRHHQRTGRRLAVLDDDPTGSQAVHGVSVVTEPRRSAYASGLARPGDTCFILTNSRALDQPRAVALNRTVARDLYTWAAEAGHSVELVSRGDSTLRGHAIAEVAAIAAERLAVTGAEPDGVLFCPAMLEAGRYTVADTHLAVVGGTPVPVGRTEFARDATFGYTSSNLREFLVERSGGGLAIDDIASLSLDDIRRGGPERVGQILSTVSGARWVVVNATDPADLEVVVLGLHRAQDAGRAFLVRSGPSLVRALAGIEPRPPLAADDLRVDDSRSAHGLVVAGSHVALTTRQLRVLQECGGLTTVELEVPALLDPASAGAHLDAATGCVVEALGHTDVLVRTSRDLVTADRPAANLDIARTVSAALVSVVRRARRARPAWIIAKGGITGHDLARRALGIRRAIVVGQFLPGQISLFDPVEAPPDVITCPYVVFPGNVGADDALALVRDRLVAATAARGLDRRPAE
ncbi:MAG: hypothetical protein HKP61_02025 [Dactylosporangium sp.]|nr:hypothetical protein [Dactylosporangium sp.]